jgi:hypothetical protein
MSFANNGRAEGAVKQPAGWIDAARREMKDSPL